MAISFAEMYGAEDGSLRMKEIKEMVATPGSRRDNNGSVPPHCGEPSE